MNHSAGKEPDPRVVYADIIDLPHHESDHHPAMSMHDRAAQFAPYAALVGFHGMIAEEARQVGSRMEPSDEELEQLSRKLNRISREIENGTRPPVSVTYFVPDPLKAGGRYETVTEKIRKVDPVRQTVILDRKTGSAGSWMEIRIADILEITGQDE